MTESTRREWLRNRLFQTTGVSIPSDLPPAAQMRLADDRSASVSIEDDGESAAQVLRLRNGSGQTVYEFGDTSLVDIASELPIPPFALYQLLASLACPETDREFSEPPQPDFGADSPVRRLAEAAIHYVDKLESRDVKGTCKGTLGCAWAVNFIAEVATGAPAGGGMSTIRMFQALESSTSIWRQIDRSDAGAGDIILSPTEGGSVGHVGILGEADRVYSNSSGSAMWKQNFTVEAWCRKYENMPKPLAVLYYRYMA